MTYGPNPWQQAHWDWRAAGNFICGGAGSGLVVCTVLSGVQGLLLSGLLLLGLGLVGLGLLCVWLEIGRPWRALHVFFNPRSSWMTREAFTASLLLPCGLAAALGIAGFAAAALVLALLFAFTQARIVLAARGIPAWREPRVVPLLMATSLAEGAGLLVMVEAIALLSSLWMPWLLAVLLLLLRALAWWAYRRALARHAADHALRALDDAGRVLWRGGTLLPLALLGGVALAAPPGWVAAPLLMLAGLAATLSGAWVKYVLITRAGFNQGFALAHLPVRGVRP